MEFNRNHIYDGFLTLERGMDSGRTPASLPRNQVSMAINATFRGGHPRTRPGWIKRNLAFLDSDSELDVDLVAGFMDGQFQGASFYEGGMAASSLVASISGRLYRISVEHGFRVQDITPTVANSARRTKAWFCQAEEFLLVNDGQSKTIVYNGGTPWRLTKDNELPVGTCMAYGQGRVWVALPNGYSFAAGDLVYSASGTPESGFRDSLLKITENDFLSEGGHFAVPPNSGGIKALQFTNNLDTSMGQGPMLVFTPNLIASIQAPIDRTAWKDLEYPIATVALQGYGALSDRSVAVVNGDVFYRSEDGIRSFAIARREFGQWGNTPVSAEMNRILERDSHNLLEYSSAIVFDNRLLSTVSPYWVQGHGVPHRGLAVLDFDILSRMHGSQPPAWDGLWTGLNILQLVKGRFNEEERCFAFVLNGANQIELWELSRDEPHDRVEGGASRIEWSLELKGLDFDTPFSLKQLEYGEVFVEDLQGEITISAEYRPDEYALWVDWHQDGWSEEAVEGMEIPATVDPPEVPRRQSRNKMRLPTPDDEADQVSDCSFRHFFRVQPRIQCVGHCRISQVRVVARHLQEHARGEHLT